MRKPSDIPQDVWEAAAVGVDYYSKRQVHIARAILAERERCEAAVQKQIEDPQSHDPSICLDMAMRAIRDGEV